MYSSVAYVTEILGQVLSLAKTPLALFLTSILIFLAFRAFMVKATSAVCSIPGANYVFPGCVRPPAPTSLKEVQSLIDAHQNLDRIQEIAAGGLSLPLQIKRGESAIREVSKRVELSDLPSR
jgi:hypothetical protein